MKTVRDARVRQSLIARLQNVRPDSTRRWGTLTPHEMLCHLGDASEMALRTRPRPTRVRERRRPLFKALLLWTAIRWPHGVKTNPSHDPRAGGTRPTVFSDDLARTVAALEAIGAASAGLEPFHGLFGAMSVRDWQRWAYKHTDFHLRQFGV